MTSALKLHFEMIKMHYRVRMNYRGDFLIALVASFVFQLIVPLFAIFVYQSGGTFPGWNLPQIILLQGIFTTVRGFSSSVFLGMLWNTIHLVHKGTFDAMLLKPRSTLHYCIMDGFDEEDMGQFVTGILLLGIGIHLAQPTGNYLLAFFLALFGVLFFYSVALLATAATFLWVKTGRMYEIIESLYTLASYPKTIYTRTVATVFTTAIPLLVIAHYPASALLGMPLEGALLGMISVTLLAFLSRIAWNQAIKKYTSAGG